MNEIVKARADSFLMCYAIGMNPNMPTGFVPMNTPPQRQMASSGAHERTGSPLLIAGITAAMALVGAAISVLLAPKTPGETFAFTVMAMVVLIPILALVAGGLGALVRAIFKSMKKPFTRNAAIMTGIIFGLGSAAMVWAMFQSSLS